jgi:membrane peptidoglycan carboxypeptidase
LAHDAGLSTLTDWRRYGLTLVLGGGEVKLLDMAGGYSVFANEGIKKETRSILRIEDTDGTVLEETEEDPQGQRVMDQEAALAISDILSDNVARTPLYGANSQLYFSDRDVAAKTGTTNDRRDAWIFGYTPNIVVGAWAGNNGNESMNEISGLIISPLWRAYMDVALAKLPNESFPEPAPIPDDIKPVLRSNGYVVDASSLVGNLSNNADVADLLELMYDNTHSILHYVDKDNPRGSYPQNPDSDPQYELWEYGVNLWKASQFGQLLGLENSSSTPTNNNRQEQEAEDVGTRQ